MSTTTTFTPKFKNLAHDLFYNDENQAVQIIISAWPTSYDVLMKLDLRLGGPGFANINCGNDGRYHSEDRDIFRPLQYIGSYFSLAAKKEAHGAWLTRDIVQAGGIQLESLVKRIAGVDRFPLGQALAEPLAKRLINATDWKRVKQYSQIYNAAKHTIDQPKDTHLFSIEDAIISYFVVRKLAAVLYPLAKMKTNLRVFEQECP